MLGPIQDIWPDRFNRINVYWIQTNKPKHKQSLYKDVDCKEFQIKSI